MAEFQVTSSQLRSKAEELQSLNGQLMSQIGTFEETENALNGMWEGEARTTFHSAFASDMTQMRNFYNAIAQYVQALQTIAQEYEKAEARAVEISSTRTYG